MAGPSAQQLASSLSGGSLSELRKRVFFVIIALIIFRIGTFIPVPGIDINVMREIFEQQRTGILGMFNMFSGGALERMSIFALGVMPYISASIIMQLLTVAVPYLEQLKKEGESGRRKITARLRWRPSSPLASRSPCPARAAAVARRWWSIRGHRSFLPRRLRWLPAPCF